MQTDQRIGHGKYSGDGIDVFAEKLYRKRLARNSQRKVSFGVRDGLQAAAGCLHFDRHVRHQLELLRHDRAGKCPVESLRENGVVK